MGSESNEHIVMLPFMAHGHLIPFLGLANLIHQKTGFTITIVNTPLNIQHLRSTISSTSTADSASAIRLAQLPFCSTDYGLPPNSENTENLSLDKIAILFSSSVHLESPFRNLIADILKKEGKPPICIISDVFFGWTTKIARSFGSRSISFTTGGAYGSLAYISLWLNLPHRTTDADEFEIPGFPNRCRLRRSQLHQFLRAADGTDLWSRFFQPQITLSMESDGWFCNTVEEIEEFGLGLLRNYIKLPIWAIGPLLPLPVLEGSGSSGSSIFPVFRQRAGKQAGIPSEKCMEWLNSFGFDSVLYISFGSQNTISSTQMMELAIGLEESCKPFIWVIRPPLGFDINGEFRQEWLPQGFEERMNESGRGVLVRNWAPQLEILSHKSIGAFLSHCGWNSVVESLSQGVPIIGWPMAAEQAYNSKMLVEEMGVSVELTRGLQSSLESKDVKKVIELVMDRNGKSEEMKKKALQIKEQIRAAVRDVGEYTGSSVTALNNFINFIRSKKEDIQI